MLEIFGLWCDIFFACYGPSCLHSFHSGKEFHLVSMSSLWKGVSLLRVKRGDPSNWFEDDLFRMIGSGLQTYFWHDLWIGEVPLVQSFHRLFTIS